MTKKSKTVQNTQITKLEKELAELKALLIGQNQSQQQIQAYNEAAKNSLLEQHKKELERQERKLDELKNQSTLTNCCILGLGALTLFGLF